MGGQRIEEYWTAEMRSVLDKYRQFEKLIPAPGKRKGSGHPGEDGRYIENILKETLKKFLPADLEILSGFILRLGVKDKNSRKRKKDEDMHSTQLDMIVYDTARMPVFQRFGDTAVVPPEGVIAVISVKKNLRADMLESEFQSLKRAAQLCAGKDRKGPFLGLVGISDKICADSDPNKKSFEKVVDAIEKSQDNTCISYEELPGYIGALDEWTIHKEHRKKARRADYLLYVHGEEEKHLGIQFLLKGILDVYYSEERGNGREPGIFSLSSRQCDEKYQEILYKKEKAGPHNG